MSTTTSTLFLIGLVCAGALLALMYFGFRVPPWYVTIPVIVTTLTVILLSVSYFISKGEDDEV